MRNMTQMPLDETHGRVWERSVNDGSMAEIPNERLPAPNGSEEPTRNEDAALLGFFGLPSQGETSNPSIGSITAFRQQFNPHGDMLSTMTGPGHMPQATATADTRCMADQGYQCNFAQQASSFGTALNLACNTPNHGDNTSPLAIPSMSLVSDPSSSRVHQGSSLLDCVAGSQLFPAPQMGTLQESVLFNERQPSFAEFSLNQSDTMQAPYEVSPATNVSAPTLLSQSMSSEPVSHRYEDQSEEDTAHGGQTSHQDNGMDGKFSKQAFFPQPASRSVPDSPSVGQFSLPMRQSYTAANLAARRQRRPAALGAAALRSSSYTTSGTSSPQSANFLSSPDGNLRRVKSSTGVLHGRVQKSGSSSQRSPYNTSFAEASKSPNSDNKSSTTSVNGFVRVEPADSDSKTPITPSSDFCPASLQSTDMTTQLSMQGVSFPSFRLNMSHENVYTEWPDMPETSTTTDSSSWLNMPSTADTSLSYASPPHTPMNSSQLARMNLGDGNQIKLAEPSLNTCSAPASQPHFPPSTNTWSNYSCQAREQFLQPPYQYNPFLRTSVARTGIPNAMQHGRAVSSVNASDFEMQGVTPTVRVQGGHSRQHLSQPSIPHQAQQEVSGHFLPQGETILPTHQSPALATPNKSPGNFHFQHYEPPEPVNPSQLPPKNSHSQPPREFNFENKGLDDF